MSDRKNIKVEQLFLTKLKERFEEDHQKVDPVLKKRNWSTRLTYLLNHFIQQELEQFDPNLHLKVRDKNGGKYPSSKTIRRAFVTNFEASRDLLHACGWYIYRKDWVNQQHLFDFSQEVQPKDQAFASQTTNLEAGTDIEVSIKNTSAKIDQVKAGGKIKIDIGNDSIK